MQKLLYIYIKAVPSRRYLRTWKICHCFASKFRNLITSWCGVVFRKNGFFNHTATKTFKLLYFIIFPERISIKKIRKPRIAATEYAFHLWILVWNRSPKMNWIVIKNILANLTQVWETKEITERMPGINFFSRLSSVAKNKCCDSKPRRLLSTSCGIYNVLFLHVITGMDIYGERYISCISWSSNRPAGSIVAIPIMLPRLLLITPCRLLNGYGRLEEL